MDFLNKLPRAPLAYENRSFINGPEGRILRMNAEYLEPLARFRRERIQDTVVFFGSARFVNLESAREGLVAAEREAGNHSPVKMLEVPYSAQFAPPEEQPDSTEAEGVRLARAAVEMARFYEDARRLAFLLTEWSMTIRSKRARFVVTSGGGPGIMEAANRGASEAGGKTIGLNIKLPFEQFPNRWITPSLNFEFHYFFMRKYWFAYLAKALVVFPGGFGTLDEAFEILTLTQTRKLAKKMPVIIYGRDYWTRVINFQALVDSGAISPKDLNLFEWANTPEEAFECLKKHLQEQLDTQSPRSLRPGGHLEDGAEAGPEISGTND
ncbi:MAG: TIGR00730 family Rossman fold protein [Acidobacteriales bacterium]|nr:TIGR00730 family Rossman fold protein [Terriglobales bacterium]